MNGGERGAAAERALSEVPLCCLRIYLDTSYRMTVDPLKELPQITGKIGRSDRETTVVYPTFTSY